ncbi:EAL domain-containing protein [Mobilicoccus pelagius]|nr:EAL domain-containing protein [Mobilicoccus pelagius]
MTGTTGQTQGHTHAGEGGLLTHFQPFYNLRNDALQGFEALVRLRRPDGGIDAPRRVFAAVEATGEMRTVDLHTLDDALAFQARFRETHPEHHSIVSVNVSWDVVAGPTLVTEVNAVLRRHRITGDRLLVDLTADIFRRLFDADAKAFARLTQLQENEVTLCLDGFTPADLDLLPAAADVPVDIIKLHPKLVAGEQRAALTEIASAVQGIGLPVVAAGVESADALDLVRELDFEWAQGFHLGAPVDAEAALAAPLALPEN